MSAFVVALFLSLGTSTWIYTKLYNRTGGNNKSSIIAAGAVGIVLFIVTWILFNSLLTS